MILHDIWHRETFIAKLTDVQQTVEQLLSQLQASEHDKFAAHLYRSRREYRSACQRAGKSGKPIERCVISTFRVAESLGFKGDFRHGNTRCGLEISPLTTLMSASGNNLTSHHTNIG